MHGFCDKCATQACESCEAGRSTVSARVKEGIARKLTNFLLSDKHAPQEVNIYVQYASSTAKLTLGADFMRELYPAEQK
jgi:hypothetical protein